jgi:hypothetical protein
MTDNITKNIIYSIQTSSLKTGSGELDIAYYYLCPRWNPGTLPCLVFHIYFSVMAKRPSACYNWVFTLNNYTPEHEAILQGMDYHYLLYGKEVAPTTGTPHLQGYVQLKKKVRRTGLVKLIPTFWEVAKGDVADQDYCKKAGDYVELGIPHSAKGAACPVKARIAMNKLLQDEPLQELVDTGVISICQVNSIAKARQRTGSFLGYVHR